MCIHVGVCMSDCGLRACACLRSRADVCVPACMCVGTTERH